jgi:hypothetical protein
MKKIIGSSGDEIEVNDDLDVEVDPDSMCESPVSISTKEQIPAIIPPEIKQIQSPSVEILIVNYSKKSLPPIKGKLVSIQVVANLCLSLSVEIDEETFERLITTDNSANPSQVKLIFNSKKEKILLMVTKNNYDDWTNPWNIVPPKYQSVKFANNQYYFEFSYVDK